MQRTDTLDIGREDVAIRIHHEHGAASARMGGTCTRRVEERAIGGSPQEPVLDVQSVPLKFRGSHVFNRTRIESSVWIGRVVLAMVSAFELLGR